MLFELHRGPNKHLAARALLSSLQLFLIGSLAACNKPPPLPPLLRDLRGHDVIGGDGSAAFTSHLTDLFPLGSPEAALVRELWLEGFTPLTALDAQERKAGFERMGSLSALAKIDAIVFWSADRNGNLTAISGIYRDQIS